MTSKSGEKRQCVIVDGRTLRRLWRHRSVAEERPDTRDIGCVRPLVSHHRLAAQTTRVADSSRRPSCPDCSLHRPSAIHPGISFSAELSPANRRRPSTSLKVIPGSSEWRHVSKPNVNSKTRTTVYVYIVISHLDYFNKVMTRYCHFTLKEVPTILSFIFFRQNSQVYLAIFPMPEMSQSDRRPFDFHWLCLWWSDRQFFDITSSAFLPVLSRGNSIGLIVQIEREREREA